MTMTRLPFPWHVTEPGLLPPDSQALILLCAAIGLIALAGYSAWSLAKEIMK